MKNVGIRTLFKKSLNSVLVSAVMTFSACNCDNRHSLREVTCEETAFEKRPLELCNGIDENCNGQVDEGCDADGDGYCGSSRDLEYLVGGPYLLDTCAKTFEDCDEVKCKVSLDCDDNNWDVNPSAVERCNGIDDNCNAEVDEYMPELESPVCGTLDEPLDGVGVCKVGLYECSNGTIVCVGETLPYVEGCDGLDNDCNGRVDDNEASMDISMCYYRMENDGGNLVKVEGDPSTMYVGLCRPGVETCTVSCPPSLPTYEVCETGKVGGDRICWGSYLPLPEECDGLDNDCDAESDEDFDFDRDSVAYCMGDCDDNDPGVFPGAEELACDDKDNDCDGLDAGRVDEDVDSYSPQGGMCGPVDCNDSNPYIYPGAAEICDCEDNNCNGIADEGLYSSTPIDILVGTDCSGSMFDKQAAIAANWANAPIPDCFSGDIIQMTNVVIDQPPYVPPITDNSRALVTVEEFKLNYGNDVSNDNCAWQEPTLNTVAYVACAVQGMDSNALCQQISSSNPFLSTQIWRSSSEKHMILITDEQAQWYPASGTVYNQLDIADLAAQAGIVVDVYTLQNYFNFDLFDPIRLYNAQSQGFGYFSTVTGGQLFDLQAELWSSTLGDTISQSFIDWYCGQ